MEKLVKSPKTWSVISSSAAVSVRVSTKVPPTSGESGRGVCDNFLYWVWSSKIIQKIFKNCKKRVFKDVQSEREEEEEEIRLRRKSLIRLRWGKIKLVIVGFPPQDKLP